MPTPPKPFTVLKSEGKSHRTKKELKQREREEKNTMSGSKIVERLEVQNNLLAHKEFLRVSKLLEKVDKDDDMYSAVVNRYCMMMAECSEFEIKKDKIYAQAQRLEEKLEELGENAGFEDLRKVTNDIAHIYGTMIALDKQIQTKRKMLLDIEKENIMTIASALRSIPKKEDTKKNPLLEALG